MISQLFSMVFYASLSGSIVAIIILLLKLIFGKKLSARWHYYIWFILIIRLLLPYSFSSPYSLFNIINMPDRGTITEKYTVVLTQPNLIGGDAAASPDSASSTNLSNTTISNKSSNDSFSMEALPGIIWITVMAAMLCYYIFAYVIFTIRVHKLPRCTDERVTKLLDECRSSMNVKKNVPVFLMRSMNSPALVSLASPKILLSPMVVEKLGDDNLRYIFMHELSHLKRKDILFNYIIILTQIIHWFNPIVWFCLVKMKEDCELACDSLVLSYVNEREHKQYGETLIKLIEMFSYSVWKPWAADMIGKTEIKRRIKMVVNFKRTSLAGTLFAVLLTALVGCSVLTDTGKSAAKSTQPSNAANTSSTAATGSSQSGNAGNSSAAAKTPINASASNQLGLDSFYTIKDAVAKTFYEKVPTDTKKFDVTGSYDLNSDGKADNFKLAFKDEVDGGGKSILSVGGKSTQLSLHQLAGVYVVDLDKSDNMKELAVVNYGLDVYIETYFYRYDGSNLTLSGNIQGGFLSDPGIPGYNVTAYNNDLKTDGKGRVIPQFGVMQYTSPQIMENTYELKNNSLKSISLDLSNTLNKEYTISQDIKPYFEQVNPVPSGYMLKYDDSSIISLKKGQKITIKKINTSINEGLYATVQLDNGKCGVLYFFLQS